MDDFLSIQVKFYVVSGLVDTILSWKAFIPLSRLTYSAYLVHPIVIYVYYGSLERPFHYSDISVVSLTKKLILFLTVIYSHKITSWGGEHW